MLRALAPYVIVAVLVGGALAWTYRAGYRAGTDHVRAEVEQAQREVRAALNRSESARLEAQAQRDELAQILEDQAFADPPSVPDALPLDRVRRLNSLK